MFSNYLCRTALKLHVFNKLLLPLRFLAARNHSWQQQRDENDRRRKTIPELVYIHNPWKYLLTKMNMLKLRCFWDRDFREDEFIRGSKQAAILISNIVRTQNLAKIGEFTTPAGFQQISRDLLISQKDERLKLIRFDGEHLRRAIPIKVATHTHYGRKFCFVDMLFVGLRNTKDFATPAEAVEISDILRRLDATFNTPHELLDVPHRIVFAEIFIRFRRDFTSSKKDKSKSVPQWSVSFYKIITFDVLNYNPK